MTLCKTGTLSQNQPVIILGIVSLNVSEKLYLLLFNYQWKFAYLNSHLSLGNLQGTIL